MDDECKEAVNQFISAVSAINKNKEMHIFQFSYFNYMKINSKICVYFGVAVCTFGFFATLYLVVAGLLIIVCGAAYYLHSKENIEASIFKMTSLEIASNKEKSKIIEYLDTH